MRKPTSTTTLEAGLTALNRRVRHLEATVSGHRLARDAGQDRARLDAARAAVRDEAEALLRLLARSEPDAGPEGLDELRDALPADLARRVGDLFGGRDRERLARLAEDARRQAEAALVLVATAEARVRLRLDEAAAEDAAARARREERDAERQLDEARRRREGADRRLVAVRDEGAARAWSDALAVASGREIPGDGHGAGTPGAAVAGRPSRASGERESDNAQVGRQELDGAVSQGPDSYCYPEHEPGALKPKDLRDG
jgi:hypothetical protein